MMLLLRRFGESLFFGLVGGIVLLVLVPVAIGWRPYTVLTGSMRPGIQPGDVVIDRPILISQAHIGQVVTFSDPSRHGELVTHRIRSIDRAGGLTNVETRGDANNTSEHWTIPTNGRVGLVEYRLPKIGHVAVLVRSRIGILVVVVIPIILLAFNVLVKIWKEDDDEDDAGQDGEGETTEPSATEPDAEPAPEPIREPVAQLMLAIDDDPFPAPSLQPAAQPPAHPAGVGADR